MSAPLRPLAHGDTYARMTVSLDGWAVEFGAKFLFLECGLLLKGIEGAARVSLALVGLHQHVSFHFCFKHASTLLLFFRFSCFNWTRARARHLAPLRSARTIAPHRPPHSSLLPSPPAQGARRRRLFVVSRDLRGRACVWAGSSCSCMSIVCAPGWRCCSIRNVLFVWLHACQSHVKTRGAPFRWAVI